jgi:hypothetical protein
MKEFQKGDRLPVDVSAASLQQKLSRDGSGSANFGRHAAQCANRKEVTDREEENEEEQRPKEPCKFYKSVD